MRINAYLARATNISRRKADVLLEASRVKIDGKVATIGSTVENGKSVVTLDNHKISLPTSHITIMLNKPTGYVVSRRGQGAKTIYDLLPTNLRQLKPIGRLDKNSSGLLLLTNDGQLIQTLSHPKNVKLKAYDVNLDRPLSEKDANAINAGIKLEDGLSRLKLLNVSQKRTKLNLIMSEGRNRQIRRTFAQLGYRVIALHRYEFAGHQLNSLKTGKWRRLEGRQVKR
jgi:23S rRNA pseudouridine2605 synthase